MKNVKSNPELIESGQVFSKDSRSSAKPVFHLTSEGKFDSKNRLDHGYHVVTLRMR